MFEVSEWRPEGKYLPLPPRDKGDGVGVELIPFGFPHEEILSHSTGGIRFPFLISPASAATTTAAEVPFVHRPGFVDSEITSADFFAIELRDCFLGSSVVCHLHKAETFRASGIAIGDDLNRFNLAALAEHVTKVSFRGLNREISNVDFFAIEAVYADLTFELVRMFLGGLTTFALRGVGDALSCGCVSELMLA